ncbi:hypothetical protein GCM10008983_13430 [Lentibacillus halophilus]|uniref:DUF1659 domain-containing protein n=1 Tax=Lentibacillus halophilus TaxID=295065 RepID=A0ABN0Z7T5_9BACI
MAVAQKVQSRLTLVLDDGYDLVTGKKVYMTKSFRNVKPDATTNNLFAIVLAINPLQKRSLYTIERTDDAIISRE